MYKIFPILFIFILTSCSEMVEKSEEQLVVYCDLESIVEKNNSEFFVGEHGTLLPGAKFVDRSKSYSGKNSIKLSKTNPYGLSILDTAAASMSKYSISVYRYKQQGILVFDAGESNGIKIYEKKSYSDRPGMGDWEKITIEYVLPKNYTGQGVKIYCWNPTDQAAWFDDIKVEITRNYKYPSYDLPKVDISIDASVQAKLNEFRKTAFDRGILMSSEKVELPARVTLEGEVYDATIRLKGDWLDHIHGNKWSFKVRLAGNKSWRGMTQFAFQSPNRRDFLNEWLIHKWMKREGVITTEYDFVSFTLNGSSLGLYVYEEQCNQNMIAKKQIDDGVILKFDESAVWEVNEKLLGKHSDTVYYPVLPASVIAPFNKKSVFRDDKKSSMFYKGQRLLKKFVLNQLEVDEVFDLDKLAKFYAISEVAKASHGYIFHNIRYYYNGATDKIEPVSYDNYNDKGEVAHFYPVNIYGPSNGIEFGLNDKMGDWMLKRALRNKTFRKTYIQHLISYSQNDYIKDLFTQYSSQLKTLEAFIQKEWSSYAYNWNFLTESAEYVNGLKDDYNKFESTALARLLASPEPFSLLNTDAWPGEHLSVVGYRDSKKDRISFINYTSTDVVLVHNQTELKVTLPKYNGVQKLKPTVIALEGRNDDWFYIGKAKTVYPIKLIKWGYRLEN